MGTRMIMAMGEGTEMLPVGLSHYLFVAAILVGFGSHGWLMLGVAREKPAK